MASPTNSNSAFGAEPILSAPVIKEMRLNRVISSVMKNIFSEREYYHFMICDEKVNTMEAFSVNRCVMVGFTI